MFAKLELKSIAGANVVTIPPKAVIEDGDKTKVVIVDGTRFSLRAIDVGPEVGGRVRVLAGLKAGEQIVTDGALFLRHEIEQL
jgi:cobalt-zinc-cadmium efflux system membrane fusion protein